MIPTKYSDFCLVCSDVQQQEIILKMSLLIESTEPP